MKKKLRIISLCLAVVMLFGIMPFAANAEQADTIVFNQAQTVTIATPGEVVDLYFTPAETGYYAFWSFDSDIDTYGYVFKGDTMLDNDDDGGEGTNFKVQVELTAGVQYTLRAKGYYSDSVGSMKVQVAKLQAPTKIEAFNNLTAFSTNIGSTLYFEVEYFPINSYSSPITYTSSNQKVVKIVNGDELLTVGAGTATITATTDNGLKDTIKITVEKAVTIKNGNSFEVSLFNPIAPTYKFTAPDTGVYVFYVLQNITMFSHVGVHAYDSNFESLGGNMDNNGQSMLYIEAEKGKTYYFTMYTEIGMDFVTVGLKKATTKGNLKSVEKEYINYVGQYVNPAIQVDPVNALVNWMDFEFSSSNAAVVEVDSDGDLYCVGVGSSTITATNPDGKSCTFKVTVKNPQKLTKTGTYRFKPTVKQSEFLYEFVPQTSGTYYIGTTTPQYGIAYVEDFASEGDTYELTAGQSYLIYAAGILNRDISFYVFKENEMPCQTMGDHKWIVLGGSAPTILTEGDIVQVCSLCGYESYGYEPKLKVKQAAEKKFTDIKKKDWYYDAVNFAFNSNLFTGTTETKFSPNDNMTRGMFVTVLGRLSGIKAAKKATTKFKDVPSNQYYAGYVDWASKAGIVNGTSATTFEPDANVTREQICVMMVKYIDYVGLCLRNDTPVVKFKDEAKISKWAKDAVLACQRGGIVNGNPSGNGYVFNPQGNATRAEVATIIYNYVKNYILMFQEHYY